MLLSLILGCLCASHPLQKVVLTSDQMHQLQVSYRYHVRTARIEWKKDAQRHEIVVEDMYAQKLEAINIEVPKGDRRFPIGTASVLELKLGDVLTFEEGLYHCNDSMIVQYPDSVILTITDRQERESIFPPPPPPDF